MAELGTVQHLYWIM